MMNKNYDQIKKALLNVVGGIIFILCFENFSSGMLDFDSIDLVQKV